MQGLPPFSSLRVSHLYRTEQKYPKCYKLTADYAFAC
uniref:Uncharacterized protein n=1 Tax=Anguilla anguilla TaxID=7936 RepID=A0A0E9PGX6_ANGAN